MAEPDYFRTRDHVPDFDDHVARYRARSRQTRAGLPNRCDVRYGQGENASLDLFFPMDRGGPAPIHLFIHGGYWRMFDKSDFSFVANTVCGAGGIAAIMNYDLMPHIRLETIVGQVRACAAWLVANAGSFGGDPKRLSVSGHSAGAHLSCFLVSKDSPVRPSAILALSGIYDLAPLCHSFLQPDLKFTDSEIARFSPLSMDIAGPGEITLLVGDAETPPFHEQAQALRTKLSNEGCAVSFEAVETANHMSIVAQLESPGTRPGRFLSAMIC
ncbi:MAG TPA: hypothetical protein DIT93_08175 [Pelagibacterium sp.]|uniref:alpha/beta hydrolase n=1 Tax=uncultured Pelagibacterium sp. TaxID=1159875 RepID=UPI000C69EA6E|nr:esterase [Pelagibacterium sp.]HCO54978.1 hypothetical protein [Pelagibacterium sp.]